MSEAPVTTCRLRITSIRSRKRAGILFAGSPAANDRVHRIGQHVVVKVVNRDVPPVEIGEIWEITGKEGTQTIQVNGYPRTERLILADQLILLKPSGSQIVHWIAEHKSIQGIGQVKAQKLWNTLGEDLYDALDRGDAAPLLDVLDNPVIVDAVLAAWAKDGDTKTLRWMQEHRIPIALARKVILVHGANTLEAMQEDPYRLLSFCASWDRVDGIACDLLGIKADDPRRLNAAVEEAVYRALDKGHTVCAREILKPSVTKLLGGSQQAGLALSLALEQKSLVEGDGGFMSAGTWIMERTVRDFVVQRIAQPLQGQLFGADADALIDAFEKQEGTTLGKPTFALNAAQRAAIKRSFTEGFSVITGGAGTGKTTVLKALYALLNTTGLPRFQMALSGRAAKRMREATGEPAYTIAGFLRNISKNEMGPSPIAVVDEASMVDLATMYRLIRHLPEQCRMILVGDPYQLPPIGAGLVLHCLTDLGAVPVSELQVVKRQSADSAIPAFARAIREGVWPDGLTADLNADVAVVPCARAELMNRTLSLYEMDRANTQILCATRSNPFSGFKPISGACCHRYTASQRAAPLLAFGEQTGFYEGDLLLYTRNDWDRDLQNGLLGRLVEAFVEPRSAGADRGEDQAIGRVEWEGRTMLLLESDLEWLEYGYAISVHKSQGSQFRRVIVPVTPGRLLDRTLVYTAVTRAQEKIVLVGDLNAVKKAVIAPPAAHLRRVALPALLREALSGHGGSPPDSRAA